jgi:hypothetical protein
VRTAQALALSDDCDLKVKHINQLLTAISMFKADFAEGKDADNERTEGGPQSKER